MVTAVMKLKDPCSFVKDPFLGRKAMTNLDSVFKSRRHHVANKGPSSQSCGFSSSRMRVEPLKRLSTEELMLLNCGAVEDF